MVNQTRCVLVWLATTAAALITGRWALGSVDPTGPFVELVTATAGLALAGCAAWAWGVCTVVVAQALRSSRPVRPSPRTVPAWAARLVLAACGVAALTVAPAHASYDVRPGGAPASPATIDGLPFPDRADGPARAPAPGPPVRDPAGSRTVVVRPGDSLWRIAASRLGPGASDAEVAAATAALFHLNRAVVGPDPDLIQPGLRLRTPGS